MLIISSLMRCFIDTLRATVQCSNVAKIYIDGNIVSVDRSFWTGSIKDNAQVIAVDCRNTNGNGGIIAYFDNGLTTDSSWRCSGYADTVWYTSSYDDSDWDSAFIIDDDDYKPSPNDDSFPSHAKWIWLNRNNQNKRHSYCRG